ncbi:MFS transporter [Gordonia spumicola]|uniref:MFS transporter n=1 Tax=Gordonia spumicola TaxID=589161 RepID=A0A7I9VCP6_9ACTN|nr:MFS transporter [Gordonia spumicola]GEE02921.1 MFS transporter [Gordonia spumicola]
MALMTPRTGTEAAAAVAPITVDLPVGRVSSRRRFYPWVVFGLAFALLLSDYMSRQVLAAVFVPLGQELDLDKGQLGSLISVVALMVGLLTLPISILADRWGRVRSLVVMAILWSLATLACAFAQSYEQLLIARFFVGVGEAAYGSVGIALVLSLFAPRVHAALSASFMAGGSFGTMIGTALGGVVAVHFGWRWSIGAMAVLGLLLVAAFKIIVTEGRVRRHQALVDTPDEKQAAPATGSARAPLSSLFTNPAVLCAYIGSGLQMFMAAVMLTWLPTFFKEEYSMTVDTAGGAAAFFVLLVGSGMIVCGVIADRVSRRDATRKWTVGIGFCSIAFVSLMIAFALPTGGLQLALMAVGAFFSAGCSGTTAAMVASLTHKSVQASAMGTLTLANNLLGLAAAPFIIGILADHMSLADALKVAPLVYIPAALAMVVGRRMHPRGVAALAALSTAVEK